MSDGENNPATKADVKEAIESALERMERFVLERELKALRWTAAIQAAYFAITLSAVWFLVSQVVGDIKTDVREIRTRVSALAPQK
jgi:hypothetical protein